jgi:hypothetical protein
MTRNEDLRVQLLDMIAEDEGVRADLAKDGSLFHTYHPRMEEVHLRNAAALRTIIEKHGWPTEEAVGQDGAEAAWRILQHAISDSTLQRKGLTLLKGAAKRGVVPLWQVAMLEDRICILEGRPQIYGTQFDWDAEGQMNPLPIADRDSVNERRRTVGLGSLEEHTIRVRRALNQSLERPPKDHAARKREMDEWARRVG